MKQMIKEEKLHHGGGSGGGLMGQALLPNKDNVVAHGTHLYSPLFYLHAYHPQY